MNIILLLNVYWSVTWYTHMVFVIHTYIHRLVQSAVAWIRTRPCRVIVTYKLCKIFTKINMEIYKTCKIHKTSSIRVTLCDWQWIGLEIPAPDWSQEVVVQNHKCSLLICLAACRMGSQAGAGWVPPDKWHDFCQGTVDLWSYIMLINRYSHTL